MADKREPRRTADPWDSSVKKQQQQGRLRESDAAQKVKSEHDARRRDDKALREGRAEHTVKNPHKKKVPGA
jgi:hypothetical protein